MAIYRGWPIEDDGDDPDNWSVAALVAPGRITKGHNEGTATAPKPCGGRLRDGAETGPPVESFGMVPDETPTDDQAGTFLEESPLQILVSHLKEHAYVVLAGELDGATAPFLLRTLVELNATLEGDLVLDIAQLSLIDSTGLSVFVSQQKKQRAKGYKFVIYGPTAMARRLFQITGLEDVLTIEPPDESTE
jgi:anti-sigma B factor antagonist